MNGGWRQRKSKTTTTTGCKSRCTALLKDALVKDPLILPIYNPNWRLCISLRATTENCRIKIIIIIINQGINRRRGHSKFGVLCESFSCSSPPSSSSPLPQLGRRWWWRWVFYWIPVKVDSDRCSLLVLLLLLCPSRWTFLLLGCCHCNTVVVDVGFVSWTLVLRTPRVDGNEWPHRRV